MGDLDLHGMTLSGEAIFSNATFEGRVNFSETNFETGADFSGANFGDPDARSRRPANFWDAYFGGDAQFWGATFPAGADFVRAIFTGRANFVGATFNGAANFGSATFHSDADFCLVIFEGYAIFSGVTIDGDACLRARKFGGFVYPPARLNGKTGLSWKHVKDKIPPLNKTDVYGAWETFFTNGGRYASASQVRTARRHYQLRPLVYGLLISFVGVLLEFAGAHGHSFREVPRSSRRRQITKLFLFSLDVLSPGIGPWKYDWNDRGGLPTQSVAVLTAIKAAIGWLILVLGAAVAVAWLIV